MSFCWRYDVFPSSRGPDVRRGFLSHLRNDFASKGLKMFNDDQGIERGWPIKTGLVKAIRESRVLIVLLSKNYASSTWCLDELVEILKCRKDGAQTVIPIFYYVNPGDVGNQRGDFGSDFVKTCQGETEQVKQRWSQALTKVAKLAGRHSANSSDDAELIEKIATDVLKELVTNVTPSMDSDENVVANEAVSSHRLFSISKRVFRGMRTIDQRIVKETVIVLSWKTKEQKIATSFVMDDEAEMIQKIATVKDFDEICDLLANETANSYKKGRFSVSKRTFRGMRMIDKRVVKEKVTVLRSQL